MKFATQLDSSYCLTSTQTCRKQIYQSIRQPLVTEQAKSLSSWIGEFAVEWQVELFKAIVGLGRFYSLVWDWTNKDGTARHTKRQEVCVTCNKIKETVAAGLFRIILQLYWPERGRKKLANVLLLDSEIWGQESKPLRMYFHFLSPISLSATLKYSPALRLCLGIPKLLRKTANLCDANPPTFTDVNIFLSDYKARQHKLPFLQSTLTFRRLTPTIVDVPHR